MHDSYPPSFFNRHDRASCSRAGLLGYWEKLLLFVNFAGLLLAVYNYLQGQRLPSAVYAAFCLVQMLTCWLQLLRRNVLSAIFGLGQTAVLAIALLIESAESLNFDPIYTAAVYTPDLIATAFSVVLCCSSFYYALVCWLAPKHDWYWRTPDRGELAFARIIRRFSLPAGAILMSLTSFGTDIRQAAYGTQDAQRDPVIESSGLQLIALFLLAFGLVSTCRIYGFRSIQFRITAGGVLACTALCLTLHGDRSGTLVILTTLGLLFWFNSNRRTMTKCLILFIYCISIFEFYQLWAFVRWNAVAFGIPGAVQEYINEKSNGVSSGTFDPLAVQLLPQSYWQLLHAIDLYNTGYGLGIRRFLDLIPQSIPQFVSDYFGYERPINGAWLLGQYRVGSGGFFVIAEGYWNTGLWGSLATSASLAAIAAGLERWYRRQSAVLSMTYLPMAGCFGFTLFYGMQPLVKAFEVAFCMAVALKWAYIGRERRRQRKEGRPDRYAPATCRRVAV